MSIYLRLFGVVEGDIMKKRSVLVVIIGLCLILGLAGVFLSVLPYNKEAKWSALYFDADLENIYNQSLDELKSAYEEITTLDYYEINSQFLEITYPKIEDKFLYGFEYENAKKGAVGNETIYKTKCFQISKNCFDKFNIEVGEGCIFSDDDMEYSPEKNIPIILGYEYANELEIGDVLRGVYIQNEFTYEVIGILRGGSNIDLGGQEVSLDRYLLMPSFNISEKPADAEADMFQVRHYANKLSGKLHYGSFDEFFKDYRKIRSINKEILQAEGEIVF